MEKDNNTSKIAGDQIIVTVDRLVIPVYTDRMEEVMHPELECTGPAKYDLTTQVSLWLHDDQKSGETTGQIVYDYLKDNGMLESCLGLSDAIAIQELGAEVFRKVFGKTIVFFMKSVVRCVHDRHLISPFLYASGSEVMLGWHWLGDCWRNFKPTPRFENNKSF